MKKKLSALLIGVVVLGLLGLGALLFRQRGSLAATHPDVNDLPPSAASARPAAAIPAPGAAGAAAGAPSAAASRSSSVATSTSAATTPAQGASESAAAGPSAAKQRGSPAAASGAAGAAPPRDSARETRPYSADGPGILRAVDSAIPAMKECYEGWRGRDGQLAGKVKINMTIEEDPKDSTRGIVTHAVSAETALRHAAVEGCMQNALSELVFERPSQKMEVTIPFQLTGPDGAGPPGTAIAKPPAATSGKAMR